MKPKHALFWISQIVMTPLLILGATLEAIGEYFTELCHRFEAWAFEYEKHGWKHVGGGIYRREESNE